MKIPFYKYQGTGNDFIIIDNSENEYSGLSQNLIHHLCDRKFGIGADGLILFNTKAGVDFEMDYFNSDGKRSSMCGNGGRSIVQFYIDKGKHQLSYTFSAPDGQHEAEVDTHGNIRLKMNNVTDVTSHNGQFILNTGSPHYVKFVNNLKEADVYEIGRDIRYSKDFKEHGINVNLVEVLEEDSIFVRTYERGVENETLSCGTGVTAAAIVAAHNQKGFNKVNVKTLGGTLSVEFKKISDIEFEDIWLCGPASMVFKGEIDVKR
jgi:diaminopimelate epimerase